MKTRERAILYTALVLLAGVNFVYLFNQTSASSFASVRTLLDTLGPADALVLSGEDQLTVQNADGRIAWSDSIHHRAFSVGFVHVDRVLDRLMQSERYRTERERLTAEIKAEEEEWRQKSADFEQKYQDITQDSPNYDEISAEFSELRAQFQEWRNKANERVNQMAVDQLRQAYTEVVDAVNVVADRKDIDMVFRFTPPEAELPGGISGQTMLDIRMRPLVRYPDGLDITAEIVSEMALPAEG